MNNANKAFIQELLDWKENVQVKINRLSMDTEKDNRSRYRLDENTTISQELRDARRSLYVLNAVLKKARDHMKFTVVSVIQEEE